jgi:c-di-GMP-binding flagellar brake protein YcgR
METLPMPLDAMSRSSAGLDEFRITSPREIAAMLRRLQDGSVRINFNGSDGTVLPTLVWAVDTHGNTITFNADADDPRTGRLVDGDESVVVGYLDSVKVQFDVHGLVLVRGPSGSVLRAAIPPVMFRFQRRQAFRVRPLANSSPTARFAHPQADGAAVALRVLDVSVGGCALFLPSGAPPLPPGSKLRRVEFSLDADTRFTSDVDVLHATDINPESKGVRLGCMFANTTAELERNLQRFIDSTQKRRRAMAL